MTASYDTKLGVGTCAGWHVALDVKRPHGRGDALPRIENYLGSIFSFFLESSKQEAKNNNMISSYNNLSHGSTAPEPVVHARVLSLGLT